MIVHDSFLIREGRVLDLEAHIRRTAAASGMDVVRLREEYGRCLRAAVRVGPWTFPRISCQDGDIFYRIRPFGPELLRATARVWTSDEVDRRTRPTVKGPDFEYQQALRGRAEAQGADEAILVGPDGAVREGAYSSVVHWKEDCLVLAEAVERLPSVTEAAVVRAALAQGVEVVRRACDPHEVATADDVWILSALHGIRTVTAWDGAPVGRTNRSAHYRELLRSMEVDVDVGSSPGPSPDVPPGPSNTSDERRLP